jgi:hypothetical protein
MTTRTETEVHDSPNLREISVARRRAIYETDAEYDPKIEKANEAWQFACSQLGMFVSCKLKEFIELAPNLGAEAAEFRRLLYQLDKRLRDDADAYIGLQAEHDRIEHKYDQLTAEYYAKNPHPVITTVDQRIERGARTKTEMNLET